MAEHIVDFYTYDEIRLHRLRTRVGAAGYYRTRNIGVSCGECQRDNSAVAVTYNIRLFQLHGGDELRGVVRHGFVVYRAGVATLPMAAALNDIDRVFVGEIACRLCERLCAAAVAVNKNERPFASAVNDIVHFYVFELNKSVILRLLRSGER